MGVSFNLHRLDRVLLANHSYIKSGGNWSDSGSALLVFTMESRAGDADDFPMSIFVDVDHIDAVAADLRAIADALVADRDRAMFEAPIRARMEREEAAAVAAMHAHESGVTP